MSTNIYAENQNNQAYTTTDNIVSAKVMNHLNSTFGTTSIQTEDPKVTFNCQMWGCGHSFKTFRGQKRHVIHCAKEPANAAKLKCGVDNCEKVFTRKFRADSHRLTHFGQKKKEDLQCQQCKVQRNTTKSLLSHEASKIYVIALR